MIDNADILLNDDIRKYIALDDKNQYLIIGRNPKNLFATKDNLYDLRISGVEPLNLDTISVFRNTEYITVNNDVEKIVYRQKWNIYGFVGLNSISATFYPKVGILLTAPKKWLISAEIGYYNNSAFYGLNIGYKIN